MTQNKTIEFYFLEGKVNSAKIEVDGVIHFSSDVRQGFTEWCICTSRTTLPDKFSNEEKKNRLVNLGVLTKKEVTLEIYSEPGYIKHHYFTNPNF